MTNFHSKKNAKRKRTIQVFINNNASSVIKAKKKYYPQSRSEECKYQQKKIKMENRIDDCIGKSSSDEYGCQSDNDKHNDESNE